MIYVYTKLYSYLYKYIFGKYYYIGCLYSTRDVHRFSERTNYFKANKILCERCCRSVKSKNDGQTKSIVKFREIKKTNEKNKNDRIKIVNDRCNNLKNERVKKCLLND